MSRLCGIVVLSFGLTAQSADIAIAWQRGFNGKSAMNQGETVNPGDKLIFSWSTGHNVYLVADSICTGKTWETFVCPSTDTEWGTQIGSGTTSPVEYTIPSDATGTKCFACKVGAHCTAGQYLVASISASPTADIVATAQGTGNHTILAEALTKAQLVTTLQGAGPFTVFAPTDAAFSAALTALGITKQQLLDRPDLADILKYHVLSGSTMSTALAASQTVNTLNGMPVTITKAGEVKFATAKVTTADVRATNGVIHVIDKVIIPPTVDIVSTAIANGNFAVLAEALTKANLVATLQGTGPFTVFAPTDTAFSAALAALSITKQQLLDRADLADILKYHVLSGKTLSASLQATQTVDTLLTGKTVTVTKNGNVVTYGDATVSSADIQASNGVIHVIDKVVLPPSGETSETSTSAASSIQRRSVAILLTCSISAFAAILA